MKLEKFRRINKKESINSKVIENSRELVDDDGYLKSLFDKFRKGARYLAVLSLLELGGSVFGNMRAADLEGAKWKETESTMQVIENKSGDKRSEQQRLGELLVIDYDKFLEKEVNAEKILVYTKASEVLSMIENFKEDATWEEISKLRYEVQYAKRSVKNHFNNLKEISEKINKNPQTSDEYKNQTNRVTHFANKIFAIIDDIAEKMERIPHIPLESVRKSAYNASVILGLHEGESFLPFDRERVRERVKKIVDNEENIDQKYLEHEFQRENWEANENIINILEEVGKRSYEGKSEYYRDGGGNLRFDYRTPERREAVHSYKLKMRESLKRLESILKKLNEYDKGGNIELQNAFKDDLNLLERKIFIADGVLKKFNNQGTPESEVYEAGENAIRDIKKLDNESRLPINPENEAEIKKMERMFAREYYKVFDKTEDVLRIFKAYPMNGRLSYNDKNDLERASQYCLDIRNSVDSLQDILDRVRGIDGGDEVYSKMLIPFSRACRVAHLGLEVFRSAFQAAGKDNEVLKMSERAINILERIKLKGE
jgi:hypothetical protein